MIKNKEFDLEEELDKQFPKGDKSRGKALVLFALAEIKIQEARKKIIEEEIEFLNSLQWCKKNKNDSSLLITLNDKISHQIIQLNKKLKEEERWRNNE